ncbi:outer membrane beta-barrel protein [Bradyrhizobium sp.]|uniref:outer membrane beta-barrel protein n=1 Tax=Bradyrhizobium sp. TaxID=376 RepID=UPI0039E260FD
MRPKLLIPALVAACVAPASALAQGAGFFVGLDASAGMAFGSSSTTNGGAPWAGGGVVNNVKFGETAGIGGHAGYRFDPALSAYVSYQYVRGDVSWDATFPMFGVASDFKGTAVSHVVMGNLAYEFALSDRTSIRTSAGLGLSFNSLSSVMETDVGTGLFLADVADHTRLSPAAQIGAGLQHRIAPKAMLSLNTSVSYTGSFETGNTRSGNLGITPITPYKIDDVWRASLSGSIRLEF